MNAILLPILGVFGLMIGSFLNVCIARLPAGESIVSPGSKCPKCGKPIAWHDNVPVLSWMLLGGKCRDCGAGISIKYPIVEAITSLCFLAQGVVYGDDLPLLGARLLFTAMLIVLFGTDLETMRLPNVITYPGIVIGLGLSVVLPPGIVAAAIGAALGAAIPWTIRWIWERLRGVEAMGLGDVKMLAMIGAFLGWKQVWVVLFLASLTGAIGGIVILKLRGRSMASRIPFGTYLAVAAFVASLVGEDLVTWYVGLYNY
ncbi:MAG TPA: prepilin peptidase [Vicinamibacterales bacterium]|nr:prepilin peptidase [Vicinamibacterales bacterium]